LVKQSEKQSGIVLHTRWRGQVDQILADVFLMQFSTFMAWLVTVQYPA